MVKYAKEIAMETTLIHQKDNLFTLESDILLVALFYSHLRISNVFFNFYTSHFMAYTQPVYKNFRIFAL